MFDTSLTSTANFQQLSDYDDVSVGHFGGSLSFILWQFLIYEMLCFEVIASVTFFNFRKEKIALTGNYLEYSKFTN